MSAFSPIVGPTQVPWGQRAFAAYLGNNVEVWKVWDAVESAKTAKERLPLLVNQHEAGESLAGQLLPDLLKAACEAAGHPLTLRMRPGYDLSYYFVATFLADHLAHHAAALGPE